VCHSSSITDEVDHNIQSFEVAYGWITLITYSTIHILKTFAFVLFILGLIGLQYGTPLNTDIDGKAADSNHSINPLNASYQQHQVSFNVEC
jgi:hypothetical protein